MLRYQTYRIAKMVNHQWVIKCRPILTSSRVRLRLGKTWFRGYPICHYSVPEKCAEKISLYWSSEKSDTYWPAMDWTHVNDVTNICSILFKYRKVTNRIPLQMVLISTISEGGSSGRLVWVKSGKLTESIEVGLSSSIWIENFIGQSKVWV